MENIIEINGVQYTKNESKQPAKKSYANSKLFSILAMTSMFSGYDMGLGTKTVKTAPCDDIVKEYELIQLKQSELSRADREWVVAQFKRNYTEVK